MIERTVATRPAVSKAPPPSLEQRIVGILADDNASAAALSALVTEAERDSTAGDQEIAQMRARASDLIATPDTETARQAVLGADLLTA
jgi:hypothetical protein